MNPVELLKRKREDMVEQHNRKIEILNIDHEAQLASIDQIIEAAGNLFGGAVTTTTKVTATGYYTSKQVIELLDGSPDRQWTLAEMMKELPFTGPSISSALHQQKGNGKVKSVGRGLWQSITGKAKPVVAPATITESPPMAPPPTTATPRPAAAPLPPQRDARAPVAIAATKAPDDWADTSGPVGQGNETVTPGSKAAVAIGNTLVEPFSATDLKARLDGDGHARSYHFVAEWKRRSWIETCGHLLYKRTARFGEGAS